MPEVDLTIEGPEDVERWLSEWLRWAFWLSANPTTDADVLQVGYVDSPYLDQVAQGKQNLIDAGLLGVGGALEVVSLTSDFESDDLGLVILTLVSRRATPLFTIDENTREVTDILEAHPQDFRATSELFLQSRPDETWAVMAWRR